MMVLESGVLPPPLRLYAAAAAASGNASSNPCFQPNPILPPHHLFPHFARFPQNLAAGFMAAGLPPFLNHQGATLRFGVANQILQNQRNLEQNMGCGNAGAGRADSASQRKRQRQYTATPTSDDSASESHSPTKGKFIDTFIISWWVQLENQQEKDSSLQLIRHFVVHKKRLARNIGVLIQW